MRRLSVLCLFVLLPALMALPASAGAAPATRTITLFLTQPHSVGPYHLSLLGLDQSRVNHAFVSVAFEKKRHRAFQTHQFSFELPGDVVTVDADLGSGSVRTGELAPGPGQRPDYGSIDMAFAPASAVHTTSVPCGTGTATLSVRSGELDGTLDFNTNTEGLGVVDVARLEAIFFQFSLPPGCSALQLLLASGGGIGPRCFSGLDLLGFQLLPDQRAASVFATKFAFGGQASTGVDLEVDESPSETAPATVSHSVSVDGPPGMLAASPSLDFARIRGDAGKPFLSGKLHFVLSGPLSEKRTKSCDTSARQGRLAGRMVAHFDVGGPVAVTHMNEAFLSRSSDRSLAGLPGPVQEPSPGMARMPVVARLRLQTRLFVGLGIRLGARLGTGLRWLDHAAATRALAASL